MNEMFNHYGEWGNAAIAIVLMSWVFYRYFAPKSWREWVGAGTVQAFIIALYAEMFGFPLTIYVLVRFFGLDDQYLSANLWSTMFGFGRTGLLLSGLVGYVFAITGVILFVRGWRKVYQARREGQMVTDGLYSVVRNPQYLGLFIALFGEGVVHWPTLFSVGLYPIIVAAYVWLAYSEEKDMDAQFGEAFRVYQGQVPMFLPNTAFWQEVVDAFRSGAEKDDTDRLD